MEQAGKAGEAKDLGSPYCSVLMARLCEHADTVKGIVCSKCLTSWYCPMCRTCGMCGFREEGGKQENGQIQTAEKVAPARSQEV